MTFCARASLLLKRLLTPRPAIFVTVATLVVTTAATTRGYVLNGKTWPSGSNIVLQLGLGNAGRTLTDGNTNWNSAAAPAIEAWNQVMARVQFSSVMNSAAALSSGDRVNTVAFSNSVFGQSFGSGTLAVTYYVMQGQNMLESDVLFNLSQTFDSYRGPLNFGSNGYAIADIRRVFLHELGHALGMNHAMGDVVMNALTSDREALADDDIAGAQAMYGVPTATPPPTPTSSSLVSISTRMNVGVNDDVLIGGFIIKGTSPKTLLLRAIGPTLAQYGVAGTLQDPLLELHDSTGATIAQNDNWQSSAQVAEIRATGKAPPNASEAALLAKLDPGAYTAIIRGVNNTQGVALVEGYEIDAPSTRMSAISTRGRIGAGDDVLIGGFAVQGTSAKRVIVRGRGPSMASFVAGVLGDPVLELHDGNGALIASNDNWASGAQATEISASGQAPPSPLESAIISNLSPGNYTAIVRGTNNTTGIGLVEVYDLEP